MANFRGSVQGERSEGTRCGHRGIYTTAGSWEGGISVRLYHNDEGKVTCCISFMTWCNGAGVDRVLYHGPIAPDMQTMLKHIPDIDHLLPKPKPPQPIVEFDDVAPPPNRKVIKEGTLVG